MQLDNNTTAVIVIAVAFVSQMAWSFLLRRGQRDYVLDLYHFRSPTTVFSRYYSWRAASLLRTVCETTLVNVFSLGAIIYFGLLVLGFYGLRELSWLIFIMIGFSAITVIQIIVNSKRMHRIQHQTVRKLTEAVDKIAEAKTMVDEYIQEGTFTKIPVWLALFRVAQIRNSVGWAMRDVLLEKRDITEREEKSNNGPSDVSNESSGPGIE